MEKLDQKLSGIPLELMKRLASRKKSGKGMKYPLEIKSFALTLQFYYAKAYEFVRKAFNLHCPIKPKFTDGIVRYLQRQVSLSHHF